MRLFLLLLAVLSSGHAFAQTAFLEKREFSAKSGTVRVKMAVSHTRKTAAELTVRLKGPGKDESTPGEVVTQDVVIVPSQFKIPPNKVRNLYISFRPELATRTPYFACVLYQPPIERMDRGPQGGGSMLLATESCSRFWVIP
jgi:P pilus assembly chaperone PapD